MRLVINLSIVILSMLYTYRYNDNHVNWNKLDALELEEVDENVSVIKLLQ